MNEVHFGWEKGQPGKQVSRLFLGPSSNPPIVLRIPKDYALG